MLSKSVRCKLVVISILLLSFSCDRDQDPEPVQALCRLTKTIGGGLTTIIEYNSSGFATKATGSYDATGEEYSVEMEYENDRLLKIINGSNSFDEFIYEEGRLKEISTMQKNVGSQTFTLARTITLEYDQGDQISKAVFTGPGFPAYGVHYERPVYLDGNVVAVYTTSNGHTYGPERLRSQVTHFDAMNNSHQAFPFIVTFMFGQNGLQGISASYNYFQSKNNALEGKLFDSNGSTTEYVTTFEYNEQGYPIKGTSASRTGELEYECDDVQ